MSPFGADSPFRGLREIFADPGVPYAGIEPGEPRTIGGVMCLGGVLLGFVVGLISPPTEAIGDAGYWVGAAMLAAMLAAAAALLRPGSEVGFDGMLVVCYLGVVFVAVGTWLAGGYGTAYIELLVLLAVFPPSIQPPRRALALLGAITLALFSPLLYESLGDGELAGLGLRAAILWVLGLTAVVVVDGVKRQRAELRAANERANRLAHTDLLTGLGNRLAFEEAVEREVERSRRTGSRLSLLACDLDDFKSVNDRFGHPRGDQLLKAVAGVIASQVRKPDLCFRWGGDEFVVLLPETPLQGAEEVARRIRGVAAADLHRPDGSPLVLSAGIAQLGEGDGGEALLTAADRELLSAKRAAAEPVTQG